MSRGEPSVSNCRSASVVASRPAALRAVWTACSVSSRERDRGMRTWMVTEESSRCTSVADMGKPSRTRQRVVSLWNRNGQHKHQWKVILLVEPLEGDTEVVLVLGVDATRRLVKGTDLQGHGGHDGGEEQFA